MLLCQSRRVLLACMWRIFEEREGVSEKLEMEKNLWLEYEAPSFPACVLH